MKRWKIINSGLTTRNLDRKELKELCKDQNAVIYNVIGILQKVMPFTPPLGLRPIHLFYDPEGPLMNHKSDASCYRVGLEASDRYFCKMAYQFAREFYHIYTASDHSNWFSEAMCEMICHHVLEQLYEIWLVEPPLPNWESYAPCFQGYLDDQLRVTHQKTVGRASVSVDKQMLLDWLKESVSDWQNPHDRERNIILAELIGFRPASEKVAVPKIGEILMEMGCLFASQLEKALQNQKKTETSGYAHTPIGAILVASGIITEQLLHRALKEQSARHRFQQLRTERPY